MSRGKNADRLQTDFWTDSRWFGGELVAELGDADVGLVRSAAWELGGGKARVGPEEDPKHRGRRHYERNVTSVAPTWEGLVLVGPFEVV